VVDLSEGVQRRTLPDLHDERNEIDTVVQRFLMLLVEWLEIVWNRIGFIQYDGSGYRSDIYRGNGCRVS